MTLDPSEPAGHEAGHPDVPDVPAAVLGWRQWRIDADDGRPRLVSPIRPVRWAPRTAMDATCSTGHPAPDDGCACGLYAARAVSTAALAADGSSATVVIGRVALWGEVVEGDGGWRAAHGYPVVLIAAPDADDQVISDLSDDYGVEVRRSPVPLAFLRALPAPAVVALRTPDRRLQVRIIELLDRHRQVASQVDREHVDEFLVVTQALYDDLRRASLRRIPREVARATGRLTLLPILWMLALITLVEGAPSTSWPPALLGALEIVVLFCAVPVVRRMGRALIEIHQMLAIRFLPGTARRLSLVVLPALLAVSVLQLLLPVHLVQGRGVAFLFPLLFAVPLTMALLGLNGCRRAFGRCSGGPGRRAACR